MPISGEPEATVGERRRVQNAAVLDNRRQLRSGLVGDDRRGKAQVSVRATAGSSNRRRAQ
jgi:hypothetical protein